MIFVVSGPGGVGKGTVVERLVASDPSLWLSRSWTTRAPRPGENPDAYTFVREDEFRRARSEGRFLESAEFLGHLYGTPWPAPPAGHDVVLEIDVQGAEQVLAARDDAVVIFLVPPDRFAQRARLEGRGDGPAHVERRLAVADAEEAAGRRLATHVVVNDDLDRAVGEVAALIGEERRHAAAGGAVRDPPVPEV